VRIGGIASGVRPSTLVAGVFASAGIEGSDPDVSRDGLVKGVSRSFSLLSVPLISSPLESFRIRSVLAVGIE